jgi:site-specific recombinase XerD
MQTDLAQFSNWLTCQYPHSSTRKHTMSDLALVFSWAGKLPSVISPHDVDSYIQYCLSNGLSPLTVNRRFSSLRLFYYFLSVINEEPVECPIISKQHFLRKPHPVLATYFIRPYLSGKKGLSCCFTLIS